MSLIELEDGTSFMITVETVGRTDGLDSAKLCQARELCTWMAVLGTWNSSYAKTINERPLLVGHDMA